MIWKSFGRVFSGLRYIILVLPLLESSTFGFSQAVTNIQISGAVQQASVNRLGVNLSDQSYWDSGQLLKNLIFRNPGFEGMKYRSILKCAQVTANTCTDDNQYSGQGTGFWTGGTYLILSGTSAGKSGTVAASTKNPNACAGCGQIITFDQNVNAAVGDFFAVTNSFPGNGDQGWWDTTQNGGSISTEMNDLSPNTPGKQALVLNATGSGQIAGVASYFDSTSGLSFIQLNGNFQVTFRAKGIGGNNQLVVSVQRSGNNSAPFLSQTLKLTNSWQDYTLPFTASENGTAVGTVGLSFQTTGASVELDDVALQQTNTNPSNTTVFRDEVVNTLKQLNPGTIRMMAAGAALGSDLINQIQVPLARYREGFNSGGTEEDDVAYGIHEFLQLCQTVGADPWITIPTATTPAEMTAFIQYLTGTGSDQYSALRIARGQAAPWNTVFNKIHIELGNETWNGDFKGESMSYPAYPLWANQVFGAARAVSSFQANQFDLILNGWSAVPGYTQAELSYSTQHDSVDIAPYLLFSLNDEAQSLQFGAMFAEPEAFDSPGGQVYQTLQYAASASHPANLNIYETNLGSMLGTSTQAQLNATQPSVGAGIAHIDHMLQMMRIGVKYQNAFALPQFEFLRSDRSLVHLWGLVLDMGTTNRRRPQFLTQALANSAIGGSMLQTVQTGANPTWNQPLSSDKVHLDGAHEIQSFAFNNNGAISVIVLNLSQNTANSVTISGAMAPSGTVQMSQITSANITDNNETSNVVQTATQTLSGFNSSTALSLPPFSMTLLTSSSTVALAPTFSVAPGTYSTAQTVALASATPNATIYFTTDGSTPTTASNTYSSPITVSSTETLNAIAVASGLSASSVSTAAYVISQATAAPAFSIPAGSYTAAQTVSISDSTPGATIFYTTDGSTPTTASQPYSGPITVAATETISAIASAAGYSNSTVATSAYTIATAAQVAAPTFSPAAGSYPSVQTVSISDTTPGATIYFTTDGSMPTTSSTAYSGPITVSSTESVNAIAVAPGFTASPASLATYFIGANSSSATINYASGFTTNGLNLYGATINNNALQLTDGNPGEVRVAWYTRPVNVQAFTTDFTFQSTAATADGFTFTLQNAPAQTWAVGQPSGALGYAGLPSSVAVKFDLYSNAGEGSDSTGFYTGGALPTTPAVDMTSSGVNLHSGDLMHAHITYDGTTLTLTLTDAVTGAAFTTSAPLNIPSIVAGNTAYAGFTAASGSNTAIQNVLAWTYTPVSPNATAATPTFTPTGGTYSSAQTVTISDTTSGATIYYTTDGSVPSTSSTQYTGPITVGASQTINAIASASGMNSSAAATANYTINGAASGPVFSVASGTYPSTQTVAISDATAGATIYFTTNGTPATPASTPYSGPITVSSSETINAIATAPNYTTSAQSSATYTITCPAATPVFSVAPGTYSSAQTLTLSDTTANATIYYTTNGLTPTTSSTPYSAPITISSSETVKAIAVAPNYTSSPVVIAAYTINGTVATPVFSVASGTYNSVQTLSITDATAGSTIYYTTDGTVPTTLSSPYLGPFTIGTSETVIAIATAPQFNNSAPASATYQIITPVAAPAFSIKPGSYPTSQVVTISDSTPEAVIYYTTDGSTPNTASLKYSRPLTVANTVCIKAIAVAPRHKESVIAVGEYTILKAASRPVFSLHSMLTSSPIHLTITDSTPGAVIYYTRDGGTPTKASTRYTEPIVIDTIDTVVPIKAVAIAPNFDPSEVVHAEYTVIPLAAKPTLSLLSGTYHTPQKLQLECSTPDATMYFTLDGSEPTTHSARYGGPIIVGRTETVKVIAVAPKYQPSLVASGDYIIQEFVKAPTFSVKPGIYLSEQTVRIAVETRGATIHYTLDGSTPTASSPMYNEPINVRRSVVIKAIAFAPGLQQSDMADAQYKIIDHGKISRAGW